MSVDLVSLLGLNHPIERIKNDLPTDEIMKQSIAFAPGLRVVRDPFFPCLISFVCSIWKNIPAIRLSLDRIRRKWGPAYRFREREYYGMPSPEVLAKATVDDFRELGLGFRAGYIKRTAEAIVAREMDINMLRGMSYEETRTKLKSLHGVGDKVADCVCLFSLGFLESFPIDVWIERVIRNHYAIFGKSGKTYARKSDAARAYFGRYAGYAQEYLFHYARSHGQVSCPA